MWNAEVSVLRRNRAPRPPMAKHSSRIHSNFFRLIGLAVLFLAAYGFIVGKDGWRWFLVGAAIAYVIAGDLTIQSLIKLVKAYRRPERE
jgi:hypothetical protein